MIANVLLKYHCQWQTFTRYFITTDIEFLQKLFFFILNFKTNEDSTADFGFQ